VARDRRRRGYAHSVALLPNRFLRAAAQRGTPTENALVTTADRHRHHLRGTHKPADKPGLARTILRDLPRHLAKAEYQVALWDRANGRLVLALPGGEGKKWVRAVIALDRRGANELRSLGQVLQRNLKDANQ